MLNQSRQLLILIISSISLLMICPFSPSIAERRILTSLPKLMGLPSSAFISVSVGFVGWGVWYEGSGVFLNDWPFCCDGMSCFLSGVPLACSLPFLMLVSPHYQLHEQCSHCDIFSQPFTFKVKSVVRRFWALRASRILMCRQLHEVRTWVIQSAGRYVSYGQRCISLKLLRIHSK